MEQAGTTTRRGPRKWASEPCWGVFGILETDVHLLPEKLVGKGIVERGCGTAYISSWLARGGARPIGLDLSERQLATAARLQREFGIRFPLVHANA